jgi:epoxyqueuosine reductase QueG
MNPADRTTWIAQQARALGFDLCGVTSVPSASSTDNNLWPELSRTAEWIALGHAGEMRWLFRSSPRISDAGSFPSARSVIVCAVNHNSAHPYSTHFSAAESHEGLLWCARRDSNSRPSGS